MHYYLFPELFIDLLESLLNYYKLKRVSLLLTLVRGVCGTPREQGALPAPQGAPALHALAVTTQDTCSEHSLLQACI